MNYNVGMISLGCSKNQVDGERLLAKIKSAGFNISGEIKNCDAVIINTCGFIEDAKQESINSILETAEYKKHGRLKAVAVTGCLAERYRELLAAEIPEADIVLGIGSNERIAEALKDALEGRRIISFGEKTGLSLEGERILTTGGASAYLKIAEGCDNRCSYCAIPLIRGGFRSRKMEDIINEAKDLAEKGVIEINLVAQDTTRYGEDIYGKLVLPELLREICKIDKLKWVRILYCYPHRVTDELIEAMACEPKIVNYLDIPIQHINNRILKEMNRRDTKEVITGVINKIRERIPGIIIRTTLISGFPGETDEDFYELLDFIREVKFDRLGCFTYSPEEDTPAAELDCQVPEDIKIFRMQEIMDTQMDIMEEKSRRYRGEILTVLCEGKETSGVYFGRSSMDAPDVDTKVYFTAEKLISPGDFVSVKIASSEYGDLKGEAETIQEEC